MMIEKRNGEKVAFDKNKIISAINKAFIEVDGTLYEDDTAKDIAIDVEKIMSNAPYLATVENVQNMVEDYLMRSERRDVARAYIRYRYKKEIARQQKENFFSAIGDKLRGRGIENSNANMDENSFSGRIGTASDIMLKQYALDFCLSEKARWNHINNRIYSHDLTHFPIGTHNCLSIPFDHLLEKGFVVRQTDVRPANSINTAFQLVAVIFQLQSLQQFGGVSSTHLDWTMVPYVRKSFYKHWKDGYKYLLKDDDADNLVFFFDKAISDDYYKQSSTVYEYAMEMTRRELAQASEGLIHNLK